MGLSQKLLKILACPQCKKELQGLGKKYLSCPRCRLKFVTKQGIPVMIINPDKIPAFDFYNQPSQERYGRESLNEMRVLVQGLIKRYLGPQGLVVELGTGQGALKNTHPNYLGIDLSFFGLKKFLKGKNCLQADIENLPLRGKSVDFIFSIATLEHLPHPERALAEIDRILKPRGLAFLAPAWFCRPWAAQGLTEKSFSELNWQGKIRKIFIPLRNSLIFRAAFILPPRLFREINYLLKSRPLPFQYKKLTPNLEDYVGPDSDAFCSMDPQAAILFFHSRGYQILSHPNFFRRIVARHKSIFVQKPPK